MDGATRFFTLGEITKRVEEILRPALGRLFWVRAEVSSGRERGGSFYCDLVETDETGGMIARMSCTVWNRDLKAIRRKFSEAGIELSLDDGTELGLRCALQFNSRHGLSLKIVDADPAFSLGELELRRREILLRLEKEGLFERNKSLPVPLLPQRIGVVTSSGSAAFNDFVKTLSLSPFGFTVLVGDAVVQGQRAEESLLGALDVLESLSPDLIVVIRGGGSRSDLASLDSEAVARRIASSNVPVWTGIGHETDTSVLDFVANRHFKTPTAVAEEIVDRYREVARHLEDAASRFRSTWSYRLQIEGERIDRDRVGLRQGSRKLLDVTRTELENRKNEASSKVQERLSSERVAIGSSRGSILSSAKILVSAAKRHLESSAAGFRTAAARNLDTAGKNLDKLRLRFRRERFLAGPAEERERLNREASQLGRIFRTAAAERRRALDLRRSRFARERLEARIALERKHLAAKEGILRSADPVTSLRRGFSLAYDGKGRLIRSVNDVARGDVIGTHVGDGTIESTVAGIREGKDGER